MYIEVSEDSFDTCRFEVVFNVKIQFLIKSKKIKDLEQSIVTHKINKKSFYITTLNSAFVYFVYI